MAQPDKRHCLQCAISAAHLIREAQRWNALAAGEPEQIVTTTLAGFAKALDRVPIPPGRPRGGRGATGVERRAAAIGARRPANGRSDTATGAAAIPYPRRGTSATVRGSKPKPS
jgi:hypothetical protein